MDDFENATVSRLRKTSFEKKPSESAEPNQPVPPVPPVPPNIIHQVLIHSSVKESVVVHNKSIVLSVLGTTHDEAVQKVSELLQALIDAGGADFVRRAANHMNELDKLEEFWDANKDQFHQITEKPISVPELKAWVEK